MVLRRSRQEGQDVVRYLAHLFNSTAVFTTAVATVSTTICCDLGSQHSIYRTPFISFNKTRGDSIDYRCGHQPNSVTVRTAVVVGYLAHKPTPISTTFSVRSILLHCVVQKGSAMLKRRSDEDRDRWIVGYGRSPRGGTNALQTCTARRWALPGHFAVLSGRAVRGRRALLLYTHTIDL